MTIMPRIDSIARANFIDYCRANRGDIPAAFRLADLYENRRKRKIAWEYLSIAARHGSADAHLRLTRWICDHLWNKCKSEHERLRTGYHIHNDNADNNIPIPPNEDHAYKLATEHLCAAISCGNNDWINKLIINPPIRPYDLHQINLHGHRSKLENINGWKVILAVWSNLSHPEEYSNRMFKPWYAPYHPSMKDTWYDYMKALLDNMLSDLKRIAKLDELSAEIALSALELHHKFFPNPSDGLEWINLKPLALSVAPLLPERFALAHQILIEEGGLLRTSEITNQARKDFILAASYDENYASRYLDLLIQRHQTARKDRFHHLFLNNDSVRVLTNIAARFPSIAKKMMHLQNSSDNTDIEEYSDLDWHKSLELELLAMEPTDDLYKIIRKYPYDAYWTWARKNPVIAINILNHPESNIEKSDIINIAHYESVYLFLLSNTTYKNHINTEELGYIAARYFLKQSGYIRDTEILYRIVIKFMFSHIKDIDIVCILRNRPELAFSTLKSGRSSGIINSNTQKEIAKIDLSAAEYLLTILENHAYPANTSINEITTCFKEIGLSHNILRFRCAKSLVEIGSTQTAAELYRTTPKSDEYYEQAMYEAGHYYVFTANEKIMALCCFRNIINSAQFDVSALIYLCERSKRSSEVSVAEIANCNARLFSPSLKEQISKDQLAQLWEDYRITEEDTGVIEESRSIYAELAMPIFTNFGRYNQMKKLIIDNPNNKFCAFFKTTLSSTKPLKMSIKNDDSNNTSPQYAATV